MSHIYKIIQTSCSELLFPKPGASQLFGEKKASSAHACRTQWFKTKRPIATQVQLTKNPHDIYVKLDNYIFGVDIVDLCIYQKHE